MTREEDQGKIIMYQVLQAELEELRKQVIMADSRLLDLETTEHALNEMDKFKKDNETLVPLGSGCYAKGNMKGSDVLLDIGGGVMVKRDSKSTKTFLSKRKKEIEDAKKKIQLQTDQIIKNINQLTPQIQKIVRESQEPHKHD